MQSYPWVVAVVIVTAAFVVPAAGAAPGPCEDSRAERTGTLKWAVSSAVFSASTAIASRVVDMEVQDGACVPVLARCEARGADGSLLRVDVTPAASSYYASWRGLVTFDDGSGVCGSARYFEGTNGALRILFEG